jgi:hypothetical protein
VLRGYAHKYFGDIVALLGKVPSDLLLVLKTNDCLRHLDRALGAPVNTAIGEFGLLFCVHSVNYIYIRFLCAQLSRTWPQMLFLKRTSSSPRLLEKKL